MTTTIDSHKALNDHLSATPHEGNDIVRYFRSLWKAGETTAKYDIESSIWYHPSDGNPDFYTGILTMQYHPPQGQQSPGLEPPNDYVDGWFKDNQNDGTHGQCNWHVVLHEFDGYMDGSMYGVNQHKTITSMKSVSLWNTVACMGQCFTTHNSAIYTFRFPQLWNGW